MAGDIRNGLGHERLEVYRPAIGWDIDSDTDLEMGESPKQEENETMKTATVTPAGCSI